MKLVHFVVCLMCIVNLLLFLVFALEGFEAFGVLAWNALGLSLVERILVHITKSGSRFVSNLLMVIVAVLLGWTLFCLCYDDIYQYNGGPQMRDVKGNGVFRRGQYNEKLNFSECAYREAEDDKRLQN